jgi:hypothetical protein
MEQTPHQYGNSNWTASNLEVSIEDQINIDFQKSKKSTHYNHYLAYNLKL